MPPGERSPPPSWLRERSRSPSRCRNSLPGSATASRISSSAMPPRCIRWPVRPGPVSSRGHPVPPGERADKIYVTNLFNHTLPLIRYEITDEVTLLDEPCRCGSGHRLIADPQGRLDDTFD